MPNNELVHQIFMGYSKQHGSIGSATFVKIFKDNALVGDGVKTSDLDIIFSKVKTKGYQTIVEQEFEQALHLVAKELGLDYQDLLQHLSKHTTPVYKGTIPEHIKLHDDHRLYTGVYKEGGPCIKGEQQPIQAQELLNRKQGDIKGPNKASSLAFEK